MIGQATKERLGSLALAVQKAEGINLKKDILRSMINEYMQGDTRQAELLVRVDGQKSLAILDYMAFEIEDVIVAKDY